MTQTTQIKTSKFPDLRKIFSFDTLVWLSCAALFYPTFRRLFTYGWKSADYEHAYFILPVFLLLVFLKRGALIPRLRPGLAGILIFGAGIVSAVFAARNGFMFLEAFAFCLVVWGIFLIKFDAASCRALWMPLAYLLFLVPPPQLVIDAMTFPLKQISIHGSYFFLQLLQVPVKLYGAILEVSGYRLFIADACSGFRSMVTLLALGSVFAFVQRLSARRKALLFFSVIPFGLFANILRITLTGFLSYHYGHEYAEGFFHEFSGYLLFLITIGGLILLSEILSRSSASTAVLPEKITFRSEASRAFWPAEPRRNSSVQSLILCALMMAAFAAGNLRPVEKIGTDHKLNMAERIPYRIPGWASITYDTSKFKDSWKAIDEVMIREYFQGEISPMAPVDREKVVLISEYNSDLRNNFTFHFPENCHRASGNQVDFQEPIAVDLGERVIKGKTLFIHGVHGTAEAVDKLVVYWLVIDGVQKHETLKIKIDQMLAGLMSGSKRGVLVRLDYMNGVEYTPQSLARAKDTIRLFIQDWYRSSDPASREVFFGKKSI